MFGTSILIENLGLNTKLTGMTVFSLCDKKVKFTQYPLKSNEQKSVDIMVFVYIKLIIYAIIKSLIKYYFISL